MVKDEKNLEEILDNKGGKNMADFEILKILTEGPKTKKQILNALEITDKQFDLLKTNLRVNGYNLGYNRVHKEYFIGGNKPAYQMNPEQLKYSNMLKDSGLTIEELKMVHKNLQAVNPQQYATKRIKFSGDKVKFGLFSDAHIGHKDYRPDVLSLAIEDFRKQDVDFIINDGDTLEGMSGREGHVYELSHIGYSNQMNYFSEQFQPFVDYGFKVYSIEAQNSHSGWYNSKANQGVDIGAELAKNCKAYDFIGYDEQDLVLDNGLKIRLRHPGGGTAYAISYKMQKYVESIGGGDKPNILTQGHFHKSNYLFYRNIHNFDAGCLQNQSPFMKKKGTPAMLGYWIIQADWDKSIGVDRIISQFRPFYD